MDLNDIILDFEIEVPGYGKVEVGDDVFFLRNDIANDTVASATNSIRNGKVIEIYRHPVSRNILFRVHADGYRRKPYLSASQLSIPPDGRDTGVTYMTGALRSTLEQIDTPYSSSIGDMRYIRGGVNDD